MRNASPRRLDMATLEHAYRILEREAPRLLVLEYLGSPVRFELTPDGEGGTELRLAHEGVRAEEWLETHAGWLNVLFPLKSWMVHGVDLRNRHGTGPRAPRAHHVATGGTALR